MHDGSPVDVEFTSRRSRRPDVRWEPIMPEELFLAVPPDHRLAALEETSLTEVAEDPFITLGRTWELRRLSDELCQSAGFTPQVAFEGDDLPMVHGFVAAGLGVAIVPRMGMTPGKRRKRESQLFTITDPGAYRDIGVAWSTERRLLPSAVLFRDFALGGRAFEARTGRQIRSVSVPRRCRGRAPGRSRPIRSRIAARLAWSRNSCGMPCSRNGVVHAGVVERSGAGRRRSRRPGRCPRC